jgi:predicted transcriptional regulator of viral defense system
MASSLQRATGEIAATFEGRAPTLTNAELAALFDQHRAAWKLAKSTTLNDFISFLRKHGALQRVELSFPHRSVTGYTWGEVPLLEQLLHLVDSSFYSHYTAVRIHGLTEQVPKTIYLNHEKSSGSADYSTHAEPFAQEAIDAAFQREPRASKNEIVYGEARIVFLSSAYQAGLGITGGNVNFGYERDLELRYTTLERTLIDIVVRPFYAGGIHEVAKAYENAKDKLSVNTMAAMLKRMAFGYPYHQSIGYLLERAGYKPSSVSIFKSMPMERDFYLVHGGEKTYVPEWRLYVPKGL